MVIIERLSKQIEDELEGACEYSYAAAEFKASKPGLSRLYRKMAATELDHAMWLHKYAAEEIAKAEHAGAKPTKEMSDKWAESHREMVDRAAKVRSNLSSM